MRGSGRKVKTAGYGGQAGPEGKAEMADARSYSSTPTKDPDTYKVT